MQKSHDGIGLEDLCREAEWLKGVAVSLGAHVCWPGRFSVCYAHSLSRLENDRDVSMYLRERPLVIARVTSVLSHVFKKESRDRRALVCVSLNALINVTVVFEMRQSIVVVFLHCFRWKITLKHNALVACTFFFHIKDESTD